MKIKLNLSGAEVAGATELEKTDAGFGGEFDRALAVVRRGAVEELSNALGCVGAVYYDFSILNRSENTMKSTGQRVLLVVGVPWNGALEKSPIDVMNEMRNRFRDLAAAGLFLFDQDSAKLDRVDRSKLIDKSEDEIEKLIHSASLYADNCDLAGVVTVSSLGMYRNISGNERRQFYLCSDDNRLVALQRLSSYLACPSCFPLHIVDTSVPGFGYANLFKSDSVTG